MKDISIMETLATVLHWSKWHRPLNVALCLVKLKFKSDVTVEFLIPDVVFVIGMPGKTDIHFCLFYNFDGNKIWHQMSSNAYGKNDI